MSNRPLPLALIILDGWGYSEQNQYNAVSGANTPVWDQLWRDYPHTFINASGEWVGLPDGQMGNSEVGHMNIGAGRVVYQDFTRISKAAKAGEFSTNETFLSAINFAKTHDSAIHILGLLSPGGVHSHEDHIHSMIEMAVQQGMEKIYIHAFLDGRDCPPKSAKTSLEALEKQLQELGKGHLVSVIGRYYAMDRDQRWERVEQAYRLIATGESEFEANDGVSALEQAYLRDETDEFVKATRINSTEEKVKMNPNDVVIFMNFRSDRARQLTQSFTATEFEHFERNMVLPNAQFVTLTQYSESFSTPIAFPPQKMNNVLGQHLSNIGLKQLRIAETEKYPHVTFFFNGGRDEPFEGEDRVLVPSPKVPTYDVKPSMSANELTEKLVADILAKKHDVIICNYANPDMVGHTGNYDAVVEAVETVDNCLGQVWQAIQQVGGEMIVTADHGNAELMHDDKTDQPHTAHTTNLVPLIYTGRTVKQMNTGRLADIAPTMLSLLGESIPEEMRDSLLIELQSHR